MIGPAEDQSPLAYLAGKLIRLTNTKFSMLRCGAGCGGYRTVTQSFCPFGFAWAWEPIVECALKAFRSSHHTSHVCDALCDILGPILIISKYYNHEKLHILKAFCSWHEKLCVMFSFFCILHRFVRPLCWRGLMRVLIYADGIMMVAYGHCVTQCYRIFENPFCVDFLFLCISISGWYNLIAMDPDAGIHGSRKLPVQRCMKVRTNVRTHAHDGCEVKKIARTNIFDNVRNATALYTTKYFFHGQFALFALFECVRELNLYFVVIIFFCCSFACPSVIMIHSFVVSVLCQEKLRQFYANYARVKWWPETVCLFHRK